MTASSSASWTRFSPSSYFVNLGTCRRCGSRSVAGHSHKKVIGRDPLVQVGTTWALTCPETVHQRPCMTREIETWLSYSRVGNNSVVDHRSRRPVLSSPLQTWFSQGIASLGIHAAVLQTPLSHWFCRNNAVSRRELCLLCAKIETSLTVDSEIR